MAFIVRTPNGWQVRWSIGQPHKYGSKVFNARKYGGWDQACAAAQQYLADHPDLDQFAPRSVPPYRQKSQANNTSGIPGVGRSHQYHGRTGQIQEYYRALVSKELDGPPHCKKFYITGERDEAEACRIAREFREMWKEAVDDGADALRRFWGEVESGWL